MTRTKKRSAPPRPKRAGPHPPLEPTRLALRVVGGIAVVASAALLAAVIRRQLPHDDAIEPASPLAAGTGTGDVARDFRVESFVQNLKRSEAQELANDLARYEATSVVVVPRARIAFGDANAPVRVTYWTDAVGAGSADLRHDLHDLRALFPDSDVVLEPRHFPRDAACNPSFSERQKSSVRCDAAAALICLESDPSAWSAADAALERPHVLHAPRAVGFNTSPLSSVPLSPARVLDIASVSVARKRVEACMASSETAAKLREDIDAAVAAGMKKPPLVLVNGRAVHRSAALLQALVLTRGQATHPAFLYLPLPQSGAVPTSAP